MRVFWIPNKKRRLFSSWKVSPLSPFIRTSKNNARHWRAACLNTWYILWCLDKIENCAVLLTSTNLLYMRKRKESSLLLCRALGHRPVSKRRDNDHFCLMCTHTWTTTHVPSHTPWSMLNFSMSRKTCLVSILGWIWPMHCLDRERRGNRLWKHMQTQSREFIQRHSAYIHRFQYVHTWSILDYIFHTEAGVAPGV